MRFEGPRTHVSSRCIATRNSCILLISLLIAGCGTYVASPGQVVEGYEKALAEGSYVSACSFLGPSTRVALARYGGAGSCVTAIARCLPSDAIIPKKDQSQLFYANELVTIHGSRAQVTISGNPVANAIRRVSLVERSVRWVLTSWGEGLTACRHRKPH